MSTKTHSEPFTNPLSESAGEFSRRGANAATETAKSATGAARDVTDAVGDAACAVTHATTDAAHHAAETAKDMYHSAALIAGDTLEISKEYTRSNPVSVVLGAFALGAAIGYTLRMVRR